MVNWPVSGFPTPTLDALEPDVKVLVVGAAIDYLRSWTHGVYGLTEATVRPRWTVTSAPSSARPHGKWSPAYIGGMWRAISCGRCAVSCSCQAPDVLRFAFRVDQVITVKIDGELLPDDQWVLLRHRELAATGDRTWPREGLEIELVAGTPVPQGGQLAAAQLAEEFAKATIGSEDCQLPQRVQTITRQGVTVGMLDSMDGLDDGRTGLWLVDAWVSSVRKAPVGGVWSVDAGGFP